MKSLYRHLLPLLIGLLAVVQISHAQLTAPRSSAKATIVQTIGLTEVSIDYSRPNVLLNDKDRTGEIWGKLVPWETTPNQLTGVAYPWRAGANENTVFTFSSDVSIEGEPLEAGSYSFHIIPHENGEATLIFNRNYHQWGSFNYEESDDALRVKITTTEVPQTNLLTFRFPEVDKESAVCELAWEKKGFPFSIAANTHEVALRHMREELGQSKGFVWQTYDIAANYCLDNDVDLDQGMAWIDRGILFFGGNFTMYNTKAKLLEKVDKQKEADAVQEKALAVATVRELNSHGSNLVNTGKIEEGFEIMKLNYDKFYTLDYDDPVEEFLVNIGLAMAYSAKEDQEMAIKYGKIGIEKAPDNLKPMAENFVAGLKKTSK